MLFVVIVTAILIINFRKDYKTAFIILGGAALLGGISYLMDFLNVEIDWGIIAIIGISALIVYFFGYGC